MLAAPIWTNSASTPSLRRATSSMKAGGNDHSRPTNSPTLSVMAFLPLRSAARNRCGCGRRCKSVVAAEILPDHLAPPGPIVGPAVPDPQGMPDVFAPEQAREILVVR